MLKTEIAPGIVVYQGVLEDPAQLILDIEDAVEANAVQWNAAAVKTSEHEGVYTDTRDTLTIGVPYMANPQVDLSNISTSFNTILAEIFFNGFDTIEKDYLSTYGVGNLDWHDTYGILKYGVGQKFTNHIDDHPDFHRRVSFVYYLNEDYVGGEINFPRFNISYKPKANEMIIFPSTYVYNHSVSEVTEGTRYAVVSWIK
jgi:hypothetical protein